MSLVDDQGKIFGILNLFDLTIFVITLVIIASLLLYVYYPLQLKEHQNVVFQMYFDVPYAIGRQVFIPGNEFIATYERRDRVVIIDTKQITNINGDIDFLVTVNASLEIDSDGRYLFNGNDVAPGNVLEVQIENSYLIGTIWRVSYTHLIAQRTVLASLDSDNLLPHAGDIISDLSGNKIGEVISAGELEQQDKQDPIKVILLSLNADIYNGDAFINEIPLTTLKRFNFITNTTLYNGTILGVY
jgi:hypothetical protein